MRNEEAKRYFLNTDMYCR